MPYCLGMTGNQDRAEQAQAWADDLQMLLMAGIDQDAAVTLGAGPAAGDLATAEKQARTIGVIARSARAVVALTPATRRTTGPDAEEEEMKHRDYSPETLERLRAELDARVDRFSAVLEAKGMVIETGCWPVARCGREPLHAPEPSVASG